jgi:hypothetical protein
MKASRILKLALLLGAAFTCAAIFAQAPAGDRPALPHDESLPELAQKPGSSHRAIRLWGPNGWYVGEESHQLAKQYAKSEKEDEKKEIRKKLTEFLAKQFDAQAKQQEKQLADLEKQIASLKATLKKRQDNKTTIIDRRIEQLIQEAEGLGWTAPSAPNPGVEFIRKANSP